MTGPSITAAKTQLTLTLLHYQLVSSRPRRWSEG